jgi:hypothetical protein
MGLPRESKRGVAAVTLQLARKQRDESRGEGTFGKQATEQVRQLERYEEGVGHRARAEHRRQYDVAYEAHEVAQQGEPADRGHRAEDRP